MRFIKILHKNIDSFHTTAMYKEESYNYEQKESLSVAKLDSDIKNMDIISINLLSLQGVFMVRTKEVSLCELNNSTGADYLNNAYFYSQYKELSEDQIIKGIEYFIKEKVHVKIMCFWIDKIILLPEFNISEEGIIAKIHDEYYARPFEDKQILTHHVIDLIDLNNDFLFAIPWNDVLNMANPEEINLICAVLKDIKNFNKPLFDIIYKEQNDAEFIDDLIDYIEFNDMNLDISELYDFDDDD